MDEGQPLFINHNFFSIYWSIIGLYPCLNLSTIFELIQLETKVERYIIEADPFNTHVYFKSIYIFGPPISIFCIWLLIIFIHTLKCDHLCTAFPCIVQMRTYLCEGELYFFFCIHLTSQDANEKLTSSGTQHFDNTAFRCYIESALNSRKHTVPQESKNVQFLMPLSRFGHDCRSVLPDSLTLAKVCWIAKATAILTVQFHKWHTLNPILFYAAHFNTQKKRKILYIG